MLWKLQSHTPAKKSGKLPPPPVNESIHCFGLSCRADHWQFVRQPVNILLTPDFVKETGEIRWK